MLTSKTAKAHLYLEGIEVDFSSLAITETVGAPPTAIVSLPPVLHIYNVLPKTNCIITVDVEMRDPKTGDTIYDIDGKKQFEEVVQFWGELRGYGLNRTAASAEVELTFNGFTDNWTTSPIVPVDSTIPTLMQSQIVGINYYQPKSGEGTKTVSEAYKSFGIYYKGFPTLLLSFADLLKNESAGVSPYLRGIKLNFKRDVTRTHLKNYTEAVSNKKNEAFKKVVSIRSNVSGTSPKELQIALQYMAKHFLLNYGEFCDSLTRSLALDTMINYIGSKVVKSFFGNSATINYLRNGLKNMGGSMSIHEVLNNILPYMRYGYQEFAAPIVVPDSTVSTGLTLSKIIFAPRPELFAPISNNTIFDDNIITASYARDLSKEPTRLIKLASPILTQNQENQTMLQMTLATVVPHHLVMGKQLGKQAEFALSHKDALSKIATLRGDVNDADLEKKLKDNARAAVEDAKKHSMDVDATDADKKAVEDSIKLEDDIKKMFITDPSGKSEFAEIKKQLSDLKMFGITNEERLRGVIPEVHNDESGIEYAFLLDALNKKQPKGTKPYDTYSDYVADDASTKYVDTGVAAMEELNPAGNIISREDALSRYYLQLSDFTYREHRRRARVLNLTTDYSPYRICGYTGTIFIKDIGIMVGVLSTIVTRISANGEASQYLVFSHIANLNTENALATPDDYLDNFTDSLPNYLSEFTIDKVGKNLYSYVTGKETSSLEDFGIAYSIKNNTDFPKGTVGTVQALQSKYYSISQIDELEKFLYTLTWRNLATMGQLMAVLRNDKTGFTPRAASKSVGWDESPRPFVTERQKAVLTIFKQVQPDIAIWKDKEGILK
ncbi:MAG: hypothetical protein WC666_03310 [Candidatus Paceibacterota bacterium]|jgi:hypothetical protein